MADIAAAAIVMANIIMILSKRTTTAAETSSRIRANTVGMPYISMEYHALYLPRMASLGRLLSGVVREEYPKLWKRRGRRQSGVFRKIFAGTRCSGSTLGCGHRDQAQRRSLYEKKNVLRD